MSTKPLGISTTYKTRVALEKPCKQRQGIVIGQLKDSHDLKRKFCTISKTLAARKSMSIV
jgi:hypothetical protein